MSEAEESKFNLMVTLVSTLLSKNEGVLVVTAEEVQKYWDAGWTYHVTDKGDLIFELLEKGRR